MLDRRSLLGGAAALVSTTAVASTSPGTTALEELIADYRWAKEALSAAETHWDVHKAMMPPIPVIRFGKRRITNRESGSVSYTKWVASYPYQIENHFAPVLNLGLCGPAQITRTKAHKARLLRALSLKWDAYERSLIESGIAAAEDAIVMAENHALQIEEAIISYRPANAIEAVRKIQFFLDELPGDRLEQADLSTLLKSVIPAVGQRRDRTG